MSSNDAADKNIYIKLRKETTKLAKIKKVNYFKEKINKSSNSQRELFRAVQSLTDSISVNQFPSEQLCDKTIAENFSNFFVTKVNRIHNALLKKKCDYQVHFPLKKVDEIQSNFVYFDNFKLTSEDELLKIVTDTGIKCGFSDAGTNLVLKEYLSVFLPIWTHIINLSLSTGSMDNLKHATITPLLKNADLDFNLLLLLSASPYSGSPQCDSNLHFTRSTSSPSLAPTLSMSSLTKSIHLLLGLPLFLLPGTAISIILFPT